MFSGFLTGKNKQITLQENDRYNQIIQKLEPMNEDEKEEQKKEEIEEDFWNQNLKQNIGQQKDFKFVKNSKESNSKKQSVETIVDEQQKQLKQYDTDLTVHKQQIYQNKFPIYEMNKLLLAKVKKLSNISQRIKNSAKEIQTKKSLIKRNSTSQKYGLDFKFVKNYFKHNYKYNQELKQFIVHHSKLIGWKLNTKNQLTIQNMIAELEYRYYIQFVLQNRTFIQLLYSQDEILFHHMILLVVRIEYSHNKIIIELSDGWYSIFYVSEVSSIMKKIKIGFKLHLINLYQYPIQFDQSQISIISQYNYPILLVTNSLNSIKKANDNSKLGKQIEPYFLRSINSLRSGIIPCLDVFVIDKSYLIRTNHSQKKAVVLKEDSQEQFMFLLQVFDSLHYFEKSEINTIQTIHICRASQYLYENIQRGMRIRILNANQVDSQIQLQIGRQNGIITDLQQYNGFVGQQKLKTGRVDIEMIVIHVIKRQNSEFFLGCEIQNKVQVKIEIWNNFFLEILQGSNLIQKQIRITQLNPITMNLFHTTLLSKVILQQ